MKTITLILLLVFLVPESHGQQVYVEVKDTVEAAYGSIGFSRDSGIIISPIFDSIGVDSVRITRLYFWKETVLLRSHTFYKPYKVYLPFEHREYFNGRKGLENDY